MAQSSIKRIGVVVKPHQPDALETLCRLTSWLGEHGITLVGPTEVERETIEHRTGCTIDVVQESELAEQVDLMLVLGGDGTMIATSRMLGSSSKILHGKRVHKRIEKWQKPYFDGS